MLSIIIIAVLEININKLSFFNNAKKVLVRASVDRKSDARNVVVSLMDDGSPCSRIMVLRKVELDKMALFFFTDKNSKKCALITKDARGSVLVWDKKNNLQITAQGKFFFVREVEKYWVQLSTQGKQQYGTLPFSSSAIEGEKDYTVTSDINSFAVIKFCPKKVDILKLDRAGHIRAIFVENSCSEWSGTWVVP